MHVHALVMTECILKMAAAREVTNAESKREERYLGRRANMDKTGALFSFLDTIADSTRTKSGSGHASQLPSFLAFCFPPILRATSIAGTVTGRELCLGLPIVEEGRGVMLTCFWLNLDGNSRDLLA